MKRSQFDVKYIHGNVVFSYGEGRVALYKLDTVSYPFLSSADKHHWRRKLDQFAYRVESDFSIYRVCRNFPVDQYAQRAMRMAEPEHQDRWLEYLKGHEDHLGSMATFVPEVYLAVRLPSDSKPKVGTGLIKHTDKIRAKVLPKSVPISRTELDALDTKEGHMLARVTGSLPARKATTREIQWLLRRAGSRGIAEPLMDSNWAPSALEVEGGDVQPLQVDIWNLVNNPAHESDRHIVIDTEHGQSHQAFLTMGDVPDEMPSPGDAELLYHALEAVDFPVDVAVHVRWMSNRESGKLVRRRVLDADNIHREATSSAHGPLSYDIEENRTLARGLDSHLRSPRHPPLILTGISFAVAAPDEHTLDKRVDALRQQFGSVTLHRPLGLQEDLYLDHLLRPNGSLVRDYDDYYTTDQLAAFMPLGTHKLGDGGGAYIGRIMSGAGRPALFDITEAPEKGRSPSILLAGALGSGKTIAAQLLAYQAYKRGSIVVDIDPKPDHNLEGTIPPEDMDVIRLEGGGEHIGLLDPLRVAPLGMREDLTNSYLMDLLYPAPAAWGTEVRKAVRRAMEANDLRCTRVIEELQRGNDEAKHVGEALEVWSASGLAALAFAPRDHELGPVDVVKQVTTIKARGLSLPSHGSSRADFDQSERIGVATLKLIAAYAMRLISGDRSVHKVVLIDEAWMLLATNDGRTLIDRLNRMGRAENATLILATQRLTDAGDIENLVGTRMGFGMETAAEAAKLLALLGLDPDDKDLRDMIRSHRRGLCLIRDDEGHIARVQFDVAYPELLRIWDTTPGKLRRVA